jgi:hypothetical protein
MNIYFGSVTFTACHTQCLKHLIFLVMPITPGEHIVHGPFHYGSINIMIFWAFLGNREPCHFNFHLIVYFAMYLHPD